MIPNNIKDTCEILMCTCRPLAISLEETNHSQNSVAHSFNTSKRRRCVPVINIWSFNSKFTSSGLLSHWEVHCKLSSSVAGVMLNLVSRGRQKDHRGRKRFCYLAAGLSLFFLLLFCMASSDKEWSLHPPLEGGCNGTRCSISVNESIIHGLQPHTPQKCLNSSLGRRFPVSIS